VKPDGAVTIATSLIPGPPNRRLFPETLTFPGVAFRLYVGAAIVKVVVADACCPFEAFTVYVTLWLLPATM
jgi:hypothetical protein